MTQKRSWGLIGRWKRRFFGGVRLTAYVFFASLVCAALGARVVYADLKEGTLQLGRELAQLGDVLGSTKTVFINGTEMNVSTSMTDQSPKEVLDRFEEVCRAHPEFLARALADIPAALKANVARAQPSELLRLGIIRSEANGDGALTCFTDDRPSSLKELPDRMKAFAASSDLAEFGRFRYVYVAGLEKGKTRVRTVWTEGSFNLKQMFPAQGDAAGFDSTVVPRPPGARRILSATAATVPYGLHIYDSSESADSLRHFYDASMEQLGWARVTDGVAAENTAVYMKDTGTMLFVTMSPKDRHTLLTAIETARDGTPTEAAVHLGN